MYPNLYYAFQDLFGIELPFLKVVQTFGFFVAMAFLAAAYVLTTELKRRERLGLMQGVKEKQLVGKPATPLELIGVGLVWFIFGYKIFGLFSINATNQDTAYVDFLLSSKGNLLGGIALGGLMAFLRYNSKKKEAAGGGTKESEVMIMPHQRVPDFTVLAAIVGFIGAKIFHNLENFGEFLSDPMGSLFSRGGFTFYGGLILASYVIIRYAKKRKISTRHLIDSAAPALMLAYAVGRMGCHFSGDGDWGIYNSAYVTDVKGTVVEVPKAEFRSALEKNKDFFLHQYQSFDNVPHASFAKPDALGFLPDWFFAYSYPHNVINEGAPIPGCEGQYCSVLPIPVFPTPLYEIITCMLMFILLMALRKKITTPGVMFGFYLILVGIERFFVELIRVNTKYEFLPLQPTQAELISLGMVIGGTLFIIYCKKRYQKELAS